MKWSGVDISLKQDVMMMFPSSSDPDFPNPSLESVANLAGVIKLMSTKGQILK
jgi:hypothetical protein